MAQSNPWGLGRAAAVTGVVQLGDLDRVLSVAQTTGHLTLAEREQCYDTSLWGPADAACAVPDAAEAAAGFPQSLKLIEATKRYDDAHAAVLAASVKAHHVSLAGATQDFTASTSLDGKLDLLRTLSGHLARIQNHISRLEARFHGDVFRRDHLLVEAEHQVNFVKLVTAAGESLSNVSHLKSSIKVAQQASAEEVAFDSSITALAEKLDSLVEQYAAIQKSRHGKPKVP